MANADAGRASRFSGTAEGVKSVGRAALSCPPGRPRCPSHRGQPQGRGGVWGAEPCRQHGVMEHGGAGLGVWCCAAETGQDHRIFRGSLLLHTVGPTVGLAEKSSPNH